MDFSTTALLIIDMQKDVIKTLVKQGVDILPNIKSLLASCRAKGMPVIYLVREHRHHGVDVEKFRSALFSEKPFLVEGTEGAKILEEIKPLPSEYIVVKRRFSGFFQSDLLMLLTRLKITSLVVCGLQTPNCIRATVTDALAYDFNVTVLEDATAAQSFEIHKANLMDMHQMGAYIKTISTFL